MTKRQLRRPYQPKPNPSSSKGATENWEWRMAENTTRVVVELSTWPYGAPWDSYEIHAEPAAAFRRVKEHLAFGRRFNTLPVGAYTVTVPGSDYKHTFEVA